MLSDSMDTLPLLLSGLLFFIGTLTANTGMLLMIVTIVLGVKTLGFMLNVKPFTQQDPFTIARILLSLGLMAGFRFSVPYIQKQEGVTKDVVLGLSISFYIIHVLYMLFGEIQVGSKTTSGQCSILGQTSGAGQEFSHPSIWLISVTYIIGFVFANALNVFNMDTPQVTKGSFPNQKDREAQQKLVDDRVMNRKLQTAMIMLSCTLVFIFVLWYRLTKTECEQSFVSLICPLSFVLLVSFFLYYYIVLDCGIRPADILGITYDMVHPDLVNNPIVCVTTPPKTS